MTKIKIEGGRLMGYLLKNKVNNTGKLEGITNNKMVNISWGGVL